jgi:NAD(P)-dependent dehydrogenase (short-subunit alcohol dehydrogenase family)
VSATSEDQLEPPPEGGGPLREGLLEELRAVVATAPEPAATSLAVAVERRCSALGATVARCELAPSVEAADDEALGRAVEDALARSGGADLLVVDGAGLFAAAEPDRALLAGMQACWDLARAVASAGIVEQGGGLVVLIAPAPGAGEHAGAATAGLENLARTLSIEWARFATRAVTIAPSDITGAEEIATLLAYLASPAGAYYSGCLLDLRGP